MKWDVWVLVNDLGVEVTRHKKSIDRTLLRHHSIVQRIFRLFLYPLGNRTDHAGGQQNCGKGLGTRVAVGHSAECIRLSILGAWAIGNGKVKVIKGGATCCPRLFSGRVQPRCPYQRHLLPPQTDDGDLEGSE